jgi:hypothetical protein
MKLLAGSRNYFRKFPAVSPENVAGVKRVDAVWC